MVMVWMRCTVCGLATKGLEEESTCPVCGEEVRALTEVEEQRAVYFSRLPIADVNTRDAVIAAALCSMPLT